jgi:hypothetical protein
MRFAFGLFSFPGLAACASGPRLDWAGGTKEERNPECETLRQAKKGRKRAGPLTPFPMPALTSVVSLLRGIAILIFDRALI